MPAQARVSDIADCSADAHGCPACPHPPKGPIIAGSPTVFVNSLPAARKDDPGIHMVCCNTNTFTCNAGSGTVFINSIAAHRKDDMTKHCGGVGKMTVCSPNVNTGG